MRLDPRIAQTKFLVEADSFSRHCLWQEWHERVQWIDQNGILQTVANVEIIHGDKIKESPICISLLWGLIDGHLVCFWHATSITVDYQIIEDWIKKHFNPELTTDAENFHSLVHHIQRQNETREVCAG